MIQYVTESTHITVTSVAVDSDVAINVTYQLEYTHNPKPTHPSPESAFANTKQVSA